MSRSLNFTLLFIIKQAGQGNVEKKSKGRTFLCDIFKILNKRTI